MTPERFRQVEELYHAAREATADERAALLARSDPELRRELESLLAERAGGEFLQRPAIQNAPELLENANVTAVAVGAWLGQYRIESKLGEGGMGEVYRARDSRLNRDVAIKVLPAVLANDADYRARFEREAHVLAALSHPNIAAIYGFESHAIVMELVEGKTLRGPLPLKEVLLISTQICEGLEAAHNKGIVHRDLKPANIKLTPEGKVKVLDFGLAKAFRVPGSDERTETQLTATATVLGTGPYMSPEQAQGKSVDSRTDIWAFGCVLYELLTGKRAFGNLAAVLQTEPDWRVLPGDTPENVRRLLRRCLQKDLADRLHHIADARLELKESPVPVSPSAARPSLLPWIAAALFAAAALGIALFHFGERPPEQQAVRFQLAPPEKTTFNEIAVSPDGRRVAFTARDAARKSQLWVRPLDGLGARMLGGTEGAAYPFWSPDSRWIGFFADGKLKKVEVSGVPPQILANAPVSRGGAWSRDGVILFAPNVYSPLVQVPATGGELKPVTELEASHQETSHRWPQFLPDGRRFLYFILSGSQQGIYTGTLDSKEKTRLLASPASAAYGMGHLLFVRERALLAQRFDPDKPQLAGEAFPVAEPAGMQLFGTRASLSETGVLVYDAVGTGGRRLQWFDRSGKPLETVGPPAEEYLSVDLSSDGLRLAADRTETPTGNRDIWLFDLARDASSRFTFRPAFNGNPVWSPDSRRIVFRSNREGSFNLYQKDASGAGEEELLLKGKLANKAPTGWSPDGHWLLYQEQDPKTRSDLWMLPRDRSEPQPWLRTEFDEDHGQFSPNGQWVAYNSNESGRNEIYVRPFAPGGATGTGKWLVSTGGGEQPRWRGDGMELFYLGLDRRMMAVEVKTAGGRFEAAAPKALFLTRAAVIPGLFYTVYAVKADGQRFMMITEGEEAVSPSATVVVNWPAALKK